MAVLVVAVKIDTDHDLTEEEREAVLWDVLVAVTEPVDSEGDKLRGYSARVLDGPKIETQP